MYNANKENQETVNRIRDELRALVNGNYRNVDGQPVEVQQDNNGYDFLEIDGVIYTENPDTDDENARELDELDPFTLADYLNKNALDINYITDAQKNYKACRILIAYGGPNIYINTFNGKVELFWWNEEAAAFLDDDVIEEIDAYQEEIFNCF